jgi:16S rRNA (guanine527-N7)-methyltransferase
MSDSSEPNVSTSRVRTALAALVPERAPSESTLSALVDWLTSLKQWNRKIDLTAARTDDELIDLFVADAAVLHLARRELAPTGSWLDVGTGAGAPGLALAVLEPDLRIELVEPNQKRVAFLRHVVGRLGLRHVNVTAARAERLRPNMADDVVSRATWPPREWLLRGMALSRQRLWVLLAQDDWHPGEGAVVYDRSYHWPLTGVARRVVAVARAQPHSEP